MITSNGPESHYNEKCGVLYPGIYLISNSLEAGGLAASAKKKQTSSTAFFTPTSQPGRTRVIQGDVCSYILLCMWNPNSKPGMPETTCDSDTQENQEFKTLLGYPQVRGKTGLHEMQAPVKPMKTQIQASKWYCTSGIPALRSWGKKTTSSRAAWAMS